MEKKNKNMVAVILKVYAIVNAIIGCIIGLSGLSDSITRYSTWYIPFFLERVSLSALAFTHLVK